MREVEVCNAEVRQAGVDGNGNGLFATRDLAAGDRIYAVNRPTLAVVSVDALSSTCSNCFWGKNAAEPDKTCYACSQCKMIYFCSKKCQSETWKTYHKYECKGLATHVDSRNGIFKNVAANTSFRMLSQLLVMRHNGVLKDDEWDAILKLKSHNLISGVEPEFALGLERAYRMQVGAILSRVGMSSSPNDIEDAISILWKLRTNGFGLLSNGDAAGGALEPHILSAMNHSCVPNAAVTMDGPRVIIHALLPIPRGKEIFMAYVRTTDYRAARRNLLYERYRFWCNCTKCTTEAAIGGDHELPWHLEMSVADAEQCLQQIKNQPLASPSSSSPLSSLSSLTPPSSSPEAAAAAEERKARTLKVGTAWAKHVLPANHLGRAVEASKLLEEGLRFCATEHLEGTQPYWAMKDLLRTWNISNGNLQKAFALDAEVYFERLPVEYPIPNDPERVRFSWRFYTLYNTFLCDLTEPELSRLPFDHCLCLYGVAKRVADVVGKSHGDDTRFAKQVYARFDEVKSDYLRGGLVNWQKMERAFDREMNRMKVYAEKNLYDRT